jgi:hypothetical protein
MRPFFVRVRVPLFAVCVAAVVTPGLIATAHAVDVPKRKPGLWEIKMTQTGAGQMPGPIQTCIDEKTDNLMQQQGQQMSKEMCPKNVVRREGNRYVIESECKVGDTRTVTKGVFTGDFNSNYRGDLHTTYDPPMMGMKETKTTIEAKWTGPCKAGQKPGDVIMPGMPSGMPKINLQDFMKGK